MARTRSESAENPQEALGRWLAQRHAAMSDYKEIINERENALLDPNQRYGPTSNSFQHARSELEEARLQRQQISGVLRRPLNRYEFKWRNFVLFAIILALLEGSVNKFLFDVALHSFGFVSYATSFVVAFSMVILAHLAGRSLRQVWSEYRSHVVWSSLAIFLAIVFVLTAIVCILTIGRAATDANTGIATFQDIFGAVTSSVTQIGIWRTLGSAFASLNALVLATVNFAGIFAAMMLAFFTHDPDKDFDLAATKVDRHRAEIEALDSRYTKARAAIINKHRSHIGSASARYKAANREVMQLKHRLGLPVDDEDRFLIDEWDQLAETSEHGDAGTLQGGSDAPSPSPSQPPHLKPVDTSTARRA